MLYVFAEVSVEVSGSEKIAISCSAIVCKAREKVEFEALAMNGEGGMRPGEAGTERKFCEAATGLPGQNSSTHEDAWRRLGGTVIVDWNPVPCDPRQRFLPLTRGTATSLR